MNEYQQALVRIIEMEDRNAELLEALEFIAKDEPPFETNEYALSLQRAARNALLTEEEN